MLALKLTTMERLGELATSSDRVCRLAASTAASCLRSCKYLV